SGCLVSRARGGGPRSHRDLARRYGPRVLARPELAHDGTPHGSCLRGDRSGPSGDDPGASRPRPIRCPLANGLAERIVAAWYLCPGQQQEPDFVSERVEGDVDAARLADHGLLLRVSSQERVAE